MLKNDLNNITNMFCPITSLPLECVGYDEGVLDGNSYYSPKSDDPEIKNLKIILSKHPQSGGMYQLVSHKSYMAKASRYFKLLGDNTWVEYKKVPNSDDLFTIDTPEDDPEWIAAVNKGIERKAKREAQNKYWADHPEEDPRLRSLTPAADLVEVKPLSPPTGILYYLDFKYDSPG